jgi:membrane-bound ClpP family serine protease
MDRLPFGKKNYQWMITGVLILVVGFTIMSIDQKQHGFGFLGLTLGPVIVMAGFIIEIFAILHRPTK